MTGRPSTSTDVRWPRGLVTSVSSLYDGLVGSPAAIRVGLGAGDASRIEALDRAGAPPSTSGTDGRPHFAAGASGSLTHCGRTTLAVIDPTGRPIGIDLERLDGPDLDPSVVLSHDEDGSDRLRVVLAAKEASGKALSALTGARFDPRAIRLVWDDDRYEAQPPHGRTAWGGQIAGEVRVFGELVVAVALRTRRRRGSGPGRP